MVREARRQRRSVDGMRMDWVVVRNRVQHVDARNQRRIDQALGEIVEVGGRGRRRRGRNAHAEGLGGYGGGPEGKGERTIFGLNTAIQAVGEGNYGRLGAGQQKRYTDAEVELLKKKKPDVVAELLEDALLGHPG